MGINISITRHLWTFCYSWKSVYFGFLNKLSNFLWTYLLHPVYYIYIIINHYVYIIYIIMYIHYIIYEDIIINYYVPNKILYFFLEDVSQWPKYYQPKESSLLRKKNFGRNSFFVANIIRMLFNFVKRLVKQLVALFKIHFFLSNIPIFDKIRFACSWKICIL